MRRSRESGNPSLRRRHLQQFLPPEFADRHHAQSSHPHEFKILKLGIGLDLAQRHRSREGPKEFRKNFRGKL